MMNLRQQYKLNRKPALDTKLHTHLNAFPKESDRCDVTFSLHVNSQTLQYFHKVHNTSGAQFFHGNTPMDLNRAFTDSHMVCNYFIHQALSDKTNNLFFACGESVVTLFQSTHLSDLCAMLTVFLYRRIQSIE